jgi:hypothetical protein
VRKQILTAVIRRDEAKTFCVVEPLYGTGCHLLNFPKGHTFRVITPSIALDSGIHFVTRGNRPRQPGSARRLKPIAIHTDAEGIPAPFSPTGLDHAPVPRATHEQSEDH